MLLTKLKIRGHSMEPFLKIDQTVLVSSIPFIFSGPKIGDVIVFKFKNKFYIKRIANKKNTKYFLTGDNKEDSLDSKKIGWIEKKDIIGKVIYRIATSH